MPDPSGQNPAASLWNQPKQFNGSASTDQWGLPGEQQSGYEDVPGANYVRPWQIVKTLDGYKDGKAVYSYDKAYADPIPKPEESAGGKNSALTAAMDALNGYLQASSLASARQKDAFSQFQQLAQYALPPGATTAPGYEPGGPAHAFAASIGLKNYTPPPIQNMPVNPAALAAEPQLSPAVMNMINAVRGAGGAQ